MLWALPCRRRGRRMAWRASTLLVIHVIGVSCFMYMYWLLPAWLKAAGPRLTH